MVTVRKDEPVTTTEHEKELAIAFLSSGELTYQEDIWNFFDSTKLPMKVTGPDFEYFSFKLQMV